MFMQNSGALRGEIAKLRAAPPGRPPPRGAVSSIPEKSIMNREAAAYWILAGACHRARRRRDPVAGMTTSCRAASCTVLFAPCPPFQNSDMKSKRVGSLRLAHPTMFFERSARRHSRADFGAQFVDQAQALLGLDVPEGPAVAGAGALRHRAHAVNRTNLVAEHDGAVGPHEGAVAFFGVHQFGAGRNHAALDQFRERDPRRVARG